MKQYKQILNLLEGLKLRGIVNNLDNEITEAEEKKISYLNFLGVLLKSEIDYRSNKRLKRNLSAAHFPSEKHLEEFQFSRVKGITKSDISSLLDFIWLYNHSNLLFFGPPGLGNYRKKNIIERNEI